ncbi:hypothetical protein [Novosphingobium panipatense]|uniref:Uncharacterized protein n=1 Tax=Novosphingobium panipatense TaxID=428991 RepID=A0ABY1Q0N6_9SPHN|nr:hypothetical protein [Novosphingobium panipatense]SMP53648.1 hypothetical protein SAMN06296065_101452 [Novosphingobium panipatense]
MNDMPDADLQRRGQARPIAEPLSPPRRAFAGRRRRISVTLDHERYIAFRTLAATHGLSGDDLAVIAIDRLLAGA